MKVIFNRFKSLFKRALFFLGQVIYLAAMATYLAAMYLTAKDMFKRAHSKTKVEDRRADPSSDSSPSARSYQKEKLPYLPQLRELPPLPPPLEQPQRDIGTPTSITLCKPIPEPPNESTQTVEATSTRSVTSLDSAEPAYGDRALVHQSLLSATPFSQKSIGRALFAASWSEVVEEDLLNHLGARERTRQEVLWEIAASEERYGLYPCLHIKSVNCPTDMSPSCSR